MVAAAPPTPPPIFPPLLPQLFLAPRSPRRERGRPKPQRNRPRNHRAFHKCARAVIPTTARRVVTACFFAGLPARFRDAPVRSGDRRWRRGLQPHPRRPRACQQHHIHCTPYCRGYYPPPAPTKSAPPPPRPCMNFQTCNRALTRSFLFGTLLCTYSLTPGAEAAEVVARTTRARSSNSQRSRSKRSGKRSTSSIPMAQGPSTRRS